MAKMQSAHQTVRTLASSIRSSTLSILFGISACTQGRGLGEAAGAQEGSTRVTDPPEGSAAAGAVAGEEGRAGRGGGSATRLDGDFFRFLFFFSPSDFL